MKGAADSHTGNRLKIRFVPKNDIPEDPVNRMRCFNVIKGLRALGWDAGVWEDGEWCDILILLSLKLDQWLRNVEKLQKQGTLVIFDLSDNEYRRRAEISKDKVKGIGRYIGNPSEVLKRFYFFFRRRKFDAFLDRMVRCCDAITVSTHQLKHDIKNYNAQVQYVPDIIDFDQSACVKGHHPTQSPVVIWVGMPNNIIFLKELSGVLSRLQEEADLRVHIISSPTAFDLYPDLNRQLAFHFTFIPWDLHTVTRELAKGDIAIAPLPQGVSKSINKIATYWWANLPVVASPSEDYRTLVVDDHNGYIANTEAEWYVYLKQLADDYRLREKLARNGRSCVLESYNPEVISKEWIDFCCQLAGDRSTCTFFQEKSRAHV